MGDAFAALTPNAFCIRKYLSENYVISSPKLNECQKKIFAEN